MANSRSKNKKRDRSQSISSVQPRNYSQYYNKEEGTSAGAISQTPSVERTVRAVAATGKSSDTVDWQGEYGHVLRDLRTLLIVSVLIFAAMIATGFLL